LKKGLFVFGKSGRFEGMGFVEGLGLVGEWIAFEVL
jgi:hypothetical protein